MCPNRKWFTTYESINGDLLRKRPDIPLDQQIFPAAEDFPLHFNRYKLPILRQFMLTSVPASRAEASVP